MYNPWGQDQPDRDESGKVQGRKRVITKDNVGGEPKFNPEVSGARTLKKMLEQHSQVILLYNLLIIARC